MALLLLKGPCKTGPAFNFDTRKCFLYLSNTFQRLFLKKITTFFLFDSINTVVQMIEVCRPEKRVQ